MKQLLNLKSSLLFLTLVTFLSSCVIVEEPYPVPGPPGPDGLPGRAFFGIDYEFQHPYSYWDDNPDIPIDPPIGTYFRTVPGLYEFEYFVNPYEYWYGTYEIWVNPGQPGRLNGVPGRNGMDTYFMLICDPDGFHSHYYNAKTSNPEEGVVIEQEQQGYTLRITLHKAHVDDRPAHEPKLKKDNSFSESNADKAGSLKAKGGKEPR